MDEPAVRGDVQPPHPVQHPTCNALQHWIPRCALERRGLNLRESCEPRRLMLFVCALFARSLMFAQQTQAGRLWLELSIVSTWNFGATHTGMHNGKVVFSLGDVVGVPNSIF